MDESKASTLIEKPMDREYLEALKDELPDTFDGSGCTPEELIGELSTKFYESRFILEAEKIAQDIRKLEWRSGDNTPPNEKLLNPEQQKRLLKSKLPKAASKFHDLLSSLPDEIKTRIDYQHLNRVKSNDERFILIEWASFTDIVTDLVNQLDQCCKNAYKEHNQGWRNPYKTQESMLALAFEKAGGGKIKVSKSNAFFHVLKTFIKYCQVSEYNADSVDETRIHRILKQRS